MRGMVHPQGVVTEAERMRATHLLFDRNEPTLSWEYTFDCARLAKRLGLSVVIDSNGFTTPEAIVRLAPFVDCVMIGVKGALSEQFYTRWMDSKGATEHVKKAILTWKEAGVYVVIADLIATQIQQPDTEFDVAAPAFYEWISEHVGEHTPLVYAPTLIPGDANDYLLPPREGLREAYEARIDRIGDLTRAAGLHYAHGGRLGWEITCHSCGSLLLRVNTPDACQYKRCRFYTHFCTCHSHEQHVTGGHCDHCGVKVPIVALSADQLATERKNADEQARLGERAFA
jgi:pyruvate formate lyase activating enzyme